MIKLFATDLDGTLLQQHTYVTNKDHIALTSISALGVDLTFASGRSDQEMTQLFKELGVNGHRVSQNGAFVVNKQGEVITESHLDQKVSPHLYDVIKKKGHHFFISTRDHIHYEEKTAFIENIQGIFKFPLKHSPTIANDLTNSTLASKFMILAEQTDLLELKTEIDRAFNGQIDCFLSATKCLDIVPVGINKAAGLNHLLQSLNIKANELAVIGDSYNDIEMLKMTPHSFVMSTADEVVKQAGAHVVDHVYEAVEYVKDMVNAS
ncbi:hypothetical protein SAMN04488134_110113 [Amphibacillus marinus]|uniref:Cof subfamily of IIB subfamily of haloacid dehalogenase superfamily/HAD-superfamily hydrolase, subfamily IIB n=1 Tax=Amphibacillus marinus TaxID=872970 RepID=A0A1H8RKA2_9BACI|nr:HAD family hydrolase [Amphibacillus marinus]SEO66614.1 hypothetical protein SAMN04488134_110113 [Amphibacillus marinus]